MDMIDILNFPGKARDRISELEAENEQLLKRIEHLALEVRGLLDVNAEYKRQAIEYSNEIDRLEEYIEALRLNSFDVG